MPPLSYAIALAGLIAPVCMPCAQAQTAVETAAFLMTGHEEDAEYVKETAPCRFTLSYLGKQSLTADFNKAARVWFKAFGPSGVVNEFKVEGAAELACSNFGGKLQCLDTIAVISDDLTKPVNQVKVRAAFAFMREKFCSGRAF